MHGVLEAAPNQTSYAATLQRLEQSRRNEEELKKLLDQKHTEQANVSAFMMHSAYIEMCGMLCNEELSRPEFDAPSSRRAWRRPSVTASTRTRSSDYRQGQP